MQTGRGLIVELTCLIIGEPQPRVSWYKGSEAVILDDRIKTENAGNRHILLLNRLRSDDVDSYMCYTINELGSAQDVIEIEHEDITEPQNGPKYAKIYVLYTSTNPLGSESKLSPKFVKIMSSAVPVPRLGHLFPKLE